MIITALLLAVLGVLTLYSSSPTLAIQQGVFILTGFLIYLGLQSFDYRVLKPLSKPLYILVLGLLVTVFVIGFETRGSVRWIPLGFVNIQPSEFAKPVLILVLAFFWSVHQPTWKNILRSLVTFLPLFLLIFRQPDLGTALTVSFIWLSILIGAGLSFGKIALMSLLAIVSTPFGWLLLQTYQRQRILSFIFPAQDPLGRGFHVIQSMISVGSGQFVGRGLGRGTQSRLQFLPEFRTDFIFAFIAEELGFMGSIIVLIFYAFLIFLVYRVMTRTSDRLGQLICVGVLGMLFFQVLVNIGMNSGIMPVTGITLPLLSYGGSSILATFICLGFVASVAKFGNKQIMGNQFDLLRV